jgi:kexin
MSNKYYSNQFGWGLLDAGLYVTAAKEWKLVKPQAWIETKTVEINHADMDEKTKEMKGGAEIIEEGTMSAIEVTEKTMKDNNFERLEHITVRVWIKHDRRGDVEVELISPNDITSSLASPRRRDDSKKGFVGWTFMTVKHW